MVQHTHTHRLVSNSHIYIKKQSLMSGKMEADEEEGELGDLCAEILENWNTPIFSEMVHQNPFSTAYSYDYDYDSDVEQVVEEQLKLSSKRKYEGDKVKDEGEREKVNSSCEKVGMDGSIIPVLVADTFYDKLLGHGTDGTDIQALVKMEEAETYADAHNSTRMPKRSEYRVFTQRNFVRRLGVMLSSNKKINMYDDFGEKMWTKPGADMTDFFNYGLDEKRWKDFCKEMRALIHSGPSETNADTNSNSIEEGEIREEEPNSGMDECSSFCSSGIAEGDDSFYHKKPYQTSFKQYINCRMIHGNKTMLP